MDSSNSDAEASQAYLTSSTNLVTPPETVSIGSSATAKRTENTTQPQELVDRILDFLATSSHETLLGVFVFLAILTYIILGRIGLVLIGIGLGVVLHASWEGPGHAAEEGGRLANTQEKKGAGAGEWPKHVSLVDQDAQDGSSPVAVPEDLSAVDLDFARFQPATAAALRSLTDAVIKDYVKFWYDPILPNESIFPASCRRALTHFVTTVASHLARKRTEDTFLQFLTNSSSIIIVFLNELAAAFAVAESPDADAKKIVDQYLETAPDSSLANVLSRDQQRKKLTMVADDILSNFLDPKTYSCSPARDFLREVFAGVILESTVVSLSRPEFINDWIIYLLQDGESEIMHAIDAGVEGARNQGVDASKGSEKKTAPSGPKNKKIHPDSRPSSPIPMDKATEDAMVEAKRLSAMIASQDVTSTPARQVARNGSPQDLPTSTEETSEATTRRGNGDQDPNSDVLANHVPSKELLPTPEAATLLPTPPSAQSTSLLQESPTPPATLHCARVLVDDDAAGGEKGLIKSRPAWDYLLQIEPASTRATGWMVFRKYSDFQSLHETLETVSRLNRIYVFADQFPALPSWKGKTRQALAQELERYLQEAINHESLAETERMRRFLEKEGNSGEASLTKPGFSFPSQSAFENMGKGVLGALTNAPKGMAGGGRAVLDGVTGVFGAVGHNRKLSSVSDRPLQHRKSPSKADRDLPVSLSFPDGSHSHNYSTVNPTVDHPTPGEDTQVQGHPIPKASPVVSPVASPGVSPIASPVAPVFDSMKDSKDPKSLTISEQDTGPSKSNLTQPDDRNSPVSIKSIEETTTTEDLQMESATMQDKPEFNGDSESVSESTRRLGNPITTDETQIAVELIFAVINELYTLSSAWNIRRTLLNAAKTYILRPGSPTLETIRELLQDSMIDSQTSDAALAESLKKLRENALPTETELQSWPPPPSEEEKARLRDTARRLFVQRGIPQALTSVMGAAASREALEKIFNSLQVETVARGFVFSIMLQGLRRSLEGSDSGKESRFQSKKTRVNLDDKISGTIDSNGERYWEISKMRRVSIASFRGKTMISVREYFEKQGQELPSKKGISMPVEQFAALVQLLPEIDQALRQQGVSLPRPEYFGSGGQAGCEIDAEPENRSRKDPPPPGVRMIIRSPGCIWTEFFPPKLIYRSSKPPSDLLMRRTQRF
ncbi:PX-associated sorting nexin 13 [Penicillium macrosclerotiorum]|uniref:PX-associated sorting nexin 13 n=1 Tax=Penicillium macrosclerotiorum TaxID=303699 RepID=UPI00254660FC|nr:PX-associated sorting nexin 13 [Penicillium macrosclerotiorum]KAJ5668814.1 PX-associated sorting nexin 13 [Penicillium macrosclerotiorum]